MPKSSRLWLDKFRDAIRGVFRGVRKHSSFRVHIPVAMLVLLLAAALGCDRIEWCLLIGGIGLVMTAELLNSALETLFHALDEPTKGRMDGCLDIAAGGVLAAALTAAAIGGLVFVPKLLVFIK